MRTGRSPSRTSSDPTTQPRTTLKGRPQNEGDEPVPSHCTILKEVRGTLCLNPGGLYPSTGGSVFQHCTVEAHANVNYFNAQEGSILNTCDEDRFVLLDFSFKNDFNSSIGVIHMVKYL